MKIIQIIPCGIPLYAVFQNSKNDGGDKFTSRIVCLALVEHDEPCLCRTVVGMNWCESEISSVELSSNFVGYSDDPIVN